MMAADCKEFSVVRTADGRVGYLAWTHDNKTLLLAEEKVVTPIEPTAQVDLFFSPRGLAQAWLRAHNKPVRKMPIAAATRHSVIKTKHGGVGVLLARDPLTAKAMVASIQPYNGGITQATMPLTEEVYILRHPGSLAQEWAALHLDIQPKEEVEETSMQLVIDQ